MKWVAGTGASEVEPSTEAFGVEGTWAAEVQVGTRVHHPFRHLGAHRGVHQEVSQG